MKRRNNTQRKDNEESPRKEINEVEACNMTEKEFRIMVVQFIHRMDGKINNLCKNQEEMKSDIATIKNTMESFKSRLEEAEERISELEDKAEKQAQSEQQLEKKIKKQEESLRELRDNMKRSNICIIGLQEGQEEQQGLENLFEELMSENFPDMGKKKSYTSTESHRQDEPQKTHAKTHHNNDGKYTRQRENLKGCKRGRNRFGSVDRASACGLKGPRFDSGQGMYLGCGHIPSRRCAGGS
uniref:Uncharacterized protein n=1 Tax=Myotis myotis TaxID=51298 RepID=A0A7J7Z513_MYOMY|nr:hypothetical protein mMyoMyo1_010632 [Myotis myotis]